MARTKVEMKDRGKIILEGNFIMNLSTQETKDWILSCFDFIKLDDKDESKLDQITEVVRKMSPDELRGYLKKILGE